MASKVEAEPRLGTVDASIIVLGAAFGDLADPFHAVVVGRDASIVHSAAGGVDAAPDPAQGPVAKQVPVQVNLVVGPEIAKLS